MKNKKILCSVCFMFAFVSVLWGQNITVKGNVTSKTDGQPIIGASVVQNDSKSTGTITDLDGNFTISVPKNASLAISYIGYKEVIIAAKPSLKIVMEEDSKMIDEVVVTGYMAEKKASLTGSVAVVKMKEVADIPTGNVMSGLQGRVAGMNVTTDGKPGGGNTDTKLRGITTINNSSPLYVIDGIQTHDNVASIISSNDVESIQVLKDAASAAIYGAQAANGVIIITTKRAKEGDVKVSFDTPEYTANTDGLGVLRILEAVRLLNLIPKTRIYQASTSELYGLVQEVPQKETTPFYPRSPYAVAKLYGYWITVNYREAYKMHASNGILFNHESPLRGETFVTRKVTRAVSRIALGMQKKVYMGNLSSKRDWGHAKDYVRAMYAILQQDEPSDYVIATGITTTIRDFLRMAFAEIGVEIIFKGENVNEVAVLNYIDEKVFIERVGEVYLDNFKKRIGDEVVGVDPQYFRPTEVDLLIGDATKARTRLGWEPKYDLASLIEDMMLNDIKLMKKESYLKEGGYEVLNYFE